MRSASLPPCLRGGRGWVPKARTRCWGDSDPIGGLAGARGGPTGGNCSSPPCPSPAPPGDERPSGVYVPTSSAPSNFLTADNQQSWANNVARIIYSMNFDSLPTSSLRFSQRYWPCAIMQGSCRLGPWLVQALAASPRHPRHGNAAACALAASVLTAREEARGARPAGRARPAEPPRTPAARGKGRCSRSARNRPHAAAPPRVCATLPALAPQGTLGCKTQQRLVSDQRWNSRRSLR